MLKAMDKNRGGRPRNENQSHKATGFHHETLADLKITKMTAHRWQVMGPVG